MKKIMILAIGLFYLNISLSQQNNITGKVIYENLSNNKRSIIEMTFSKYSYAYKYIGMPSVPTTKKNYNNIEDSLNEASRQKRINEEMAKMPVQEWYGNLSSNVITYSTFDNKHNMYCIRDTITLLRWQLQPDTATINGLFCQKATCKLMNGEYVAWYASSVPVSVAPFTFRGLPGLLVKVYNSVTKSTISMTRLEWPIKELVPIAPCSVGPYISKAEFKTINDKLVKESRNLIESMKSSEFRRTYRQ